MWWWRCKRLFSDARGRGSERAKGTTLGGPLGFSWENELNPKEGVPTPSQLVKPLVLRLKGWMYFQDKIVSEVLVLGAGMGFFC